MEVSNDDGEEDGNVDENTDYGNNTSNEPTNSVILTARRDPPANPDIAKRASSGEKLWSSQAAAMARPIPTQPLDVCTPELGKWQVVPDSVSGIAVDRDLWSQLMPTHFVNPNPTPQWTMATKWTTVSAILEPTTEDPPAGSQPLVFEFRNAYAPRTGTIINLVHRDRLRINNNEIASPSPWNIPTWAQWEMRCYETGTPLESLKTVAIQDIRHKAIKELMRYGMRGRTPMPFDAIPGMRPSKERVIGAVITEASDPDAFYALLIMPIIQSLSKMLLDHKFELGRKKIGSISVILVLDRPTQYGTSWDMVISLEDY